MIVHREKLWIVLFDIRKGDAVSTSGLKRRTLLVLRLSTTTYAFRGLIWGVNSIGLPLHVPSSTHDRSSHPQLTSHG